MTVQEFQDSLIAATKTLASKLDSENSSTLTIECTITATEDADAGVYTVEYLGSKFSASATDRNIPYIKGDNVYVIVPNGDFSKQKFIISYPTNNITSSNSGSSSEQITGNDILFFPKDQIDLHSYREETIPITFTSDFYKETLPLYQQYYNEFTFSYKLKTEDLAENTDPNHSGYGIKLTIPYLNEDGVEEIFESILGVQNDKGKSNIIGDSFYLPMWVKQSVDISFPKKCIIQPEGVKAEAFTYGFKNKDESQPADIHIKQVSFKAVRNFTSDELSKYFVYIDSSEGFFLREDPVPATTLTAILKSKGSDVLMTTVPVYWFLQDPSIVIIDNEEPEGYNSIGGEGWRLLSREVSYEVQHSAVHPENLYKCVVLYDGKEVIQYISIKNLGDKTKIILETENGSFNIAKDIGVAEISCKVLGVDKYSYLWGAYDEDLNFITYGYKEDGSESFTLDAKDMDNTTYFQVIAAGETSAIGRGYCTCALFDSLGYYVEINHGDTDITYDKEGNSPNADDYNGTAYEGTNISRFKRTPFTYTVYRSDGVKINNSEYEKITATWRVPVNEPRLLDGNGNIYYGSMFNFTLPTGDKKEILEDDKLYTEFSYIGQSKKLSWKIDDKYDNRKRNNKIYLTVSFDNKKLYDNVSYYFNKENKENNNPDEPIKLGNSENGQIIFNEDGGFIAGIKINKDRLMSNNIEFIANDSIKNLLGWSLNQDGSAYFKNLTVDKLVVNGETISGGGGSGSDTPPASDDSNLIPIVKGTKAEIDAMMSANLIREGSMVVILDD